MCFRCTGNLICVNFCKVDKLPSQNSGVLSDYQNGKLAFGFGKMVLETFFPSRSHTYVYQFPYISVNSVSAADSRVVLSSHFCTPL